MRKTAALLLALFALSIDCAAQTPEITPAPGQVNPYKTRSELLMEATRYTGVYTVECAASVWARGLMERSAAVQYSVMTEELKKDYAEQLDALRSNWVTGMSSPWVDSFSVAGIDMRGEDSAIAALKFWTATSAGPSGEYVAKLLITRESGFWRVAQIWADDGLYPYTLYKR